MGSSNWSIWSTQYTKVHHNFMRAALNISHPALEQEERILHNYMNNDGANSIHNFIKFIDGRIDIEDARKIQNELTEFLEAA